LPTISLTWVRPSAPGPSASVTSATSPPAPNFVFAFIWSESPSFSITRAMWTPAAPPPAGLA
jgi:hypothetical protein